MELPGRVPEELEPLLKWFGHGVVEGVVVAEFAGVVVVVVEPDALHHHDHTRQSS
jgi:hypothetical protein